MFQVILSKKPIANCFSSVANFGRVPRIKRGIIPRKKKCKKSSKYAYIHISSLSYIPTNFNKILLGGFRRVALTNYFSNILNLGQISLSFVKLRAKSTPTPNLLQDFMKFCWAHKNSTTCTGFHKVLLSGFRGVVLTKQNKTDWLTDERVKTYSPQLVAWCIIKCLISSKVNGFGHIDFLEFIYIIW